VGLLETNFEAGLKISPVHCQCTGRLDSQLSAAQTARDLSRCNYRSWQQISSANGLGCAASVLTADEASKILKASPSTVRRWLELKTLKGKQACPTAPWIIHRSEVERFAAQVDTHGRRAENGHQINP
jgi:hypothetical protein